MCNYSCTCVCLAAVVWCVAPAVMFLKHGYSTMCIGFIVMHHSVWARLCAITKSTTAIPYVYNAGSVGNISLRVAV